MKGGQRVFAYNVTFRRKVTAGGLVRPVHATRLPQYGGAGKLGCSVDAAPSVAVVAGQVVEDAAAAAAAPSRSDHTLLLGGLQLNARFVSFAAGPSPQRAGGCAPRPLQPDAPFAPVLPWQRLVLLPQCYVPLGILDVVIGQLGSSDFPLKTGNVERDRKKKSGQAERETVFNNNIKNQGYDPIVDQNIF